MILGPGPALDREVARRLREKGSEATPYSTDPSLAEDLTVCLARSSITVSCEEVNATWYCVLAGDVAGTRQRVASGSGETRSLALCRAIAHLPKPQATTDGGARSRTSERSAFPKGFCQGCGRLLEKQTHSQSAWCSVCGYQRGRPAQIAFEKGRRQPHKR